MGKLSKEEFIRAMAIVKVARVRIYRDVSPPHQEEVRVDMGELYRDAMDLYGAHHPDEDYRHGAEILNWLLDRVFEDVLVTNLDPESPTSVHIGHG